MAPHGQALAAGVECTWRTNILSVELRPMGPGEILSAAAELDIIELLLEAPPTRAHEELEYEQDLPVALERSFDQVMDELRDEPVEDGYCHPGDESVAELLRTFGDQSRRYLVSRMAALDFPGPLVADLLRLLGRQRRENVPSEWVVDVIRMALSSEDVEIRDAAVQAVELLEERAAVEVLEQHAEPCGWLADYIARVVVDLKG